VKDGTTRLEAFSDGVFAIAITLLVLEIRVPEPGHGALWAGLAALWPSYLAFAMSFFVVLVMWVNHHELARMVRTVDYPLLFANGLLLLSVTFVPFPTAVLAQYLATDEATAAVAFYCGTFFVTSLTWTLLFFVIVRRGLLLSHVAPATVARVQRAYTLGPAVYAVATAAVFVNVVMGLVLNTSLWVLWIRLCYHSTDDALAAEP
jgi:TMEM175 potassium channel family protein